MQSLTIIISSISASDVDADIARVAIRYILLAKAFALWFISGLGCVGAKAGCTIFPHRRLAAVSFYARRFIDRGCWRNFAQSGMDVPVTNGIVTP